MHSFVTQCINFENSFTLITREVARVSLSYAAISYFWVTFSPVILRAFKFNLFCLLIKHTICEPKIWYCRIAQCHSGILPGDLSEGIFKIDSLGHKRINKQFLKSSRRAYWTRSTGQGVDYRILLKDDMLSSLLPIKSRKWSSEILLPFGSFSVLSLLEIILSLISPFV